MNPLCSRVNSHLIKPDVEVPGELHPTENYTEGARVVFFAFYNRLCVRIVCVCPCECVCVCVHVLQALFVYCVCACYCLLLRGIWSDCNLNTEITAMPDSDKHSQRSSSLLISPSLISLSLWRSNRTWQKEERCEFCGIQVTNWLIFLDSRLLMVHRLQKLAAFFFFVCVCV